MIDLELVAMGRARAAHSAIPQPALDGLHDTVGLVVGIEVAEGHGQHMGGPDVVGVYGAGRAACRAHLAASAVIDAEQLIGVFHIVGLEILFGQRGHAHALIGLGDLLLHLTLVHYQVFHHRQARKRLRQAGAPRRRVQARRRAS